MKRTVYTLRRCEHAPFWKQLLYRHAMAVTETHVFPRCQGAPAYPVCPRCRQTLEREYMAFCSRCGQKLDWQPYPVARIVYMEPSHDPIKLTCDEVCPR